MARPDDSPTRPPRLAAVRDTAPPRSRTVRELDWSLLMARAQNGDADAYRRLLHEVAPYVRQLARRALDSTAEAEDTVQETLLTLHAVRHTYDPLRPFGPWLVALAQRRIVDAQRRQGRRRAREVPLEDEHDIAAEEIAPGTDAQTLERALGSLPESQRQAVRLLKLRELSLKEAAAASGMSAGALKVAMHRALASLRRALKGKP